MHWRSNSRSGFTIVELLVVVAIIAILASVVLGQLGSARDQAFFSRAQAEFREFNNALEQYNLDERSYPDDTARGVVPPGLTDLLPDDGFDSGPWANSQYSYDAYEISGEDVVQFSLHFCPAGATDPGDCNFPGQDWADDFDVNSTLFYCVLGDCRASPSEPQEYPGYCVNCDCQDMTECYGPE